MKVVCQMTSAHKSDDIRIFYKECVSLSENGYKVFLVAPDESYIRSGVEIIGIKQENKGRLWRMLFMSKAIYKQASKIRADIYHIHDPELLPYALKLKKKGKKVIYDSHEDVPRQILAKTWIPKVLRKYVSKIFENYEKHVARQLDYVITATDHIADIFKKSGSLARAVKNYPMLTDIECKNENYFERENIICYAGGVTEQRGITQMVKAVDNLDVKLQIAGAIDDNYQKQLSVLPGRSKTDFLGFLNREQISDLYNRSKAGMVVLKNTPNHREALPIKMFEYMAAGIPVIASKFPVWEKIIDEVGCGICVDPDSVQEIVVAIKRLIENPDLAMNMGKNGRKAICEKYSWEMEVKKLLLVYQETI